MRNILLTCDVNYINRTVSRNGVPEFGIIGSANALMIAMSVGQPEGVELLIKAGADVHYLDRNGSNALMYACVLGNTQNVRYWLQRFETWDVEAKNHVVGATALGCAVYVAPYSLEIVKMLLNAGAIAHGVSDNGTTHLIAHCSNENADPEVLNMLLKSKKVNVNARIQPHTLRWKFIYKFAKFMTRINSSSSTILNSVVRRKGQTALHYAARRGDIEIVEMLLGAGADPNIKSDVGEEAVDLSSAFPELRGMLEKRKRKLRLKATKEKLKRTNKMREEKLGKRISTATPIQHDMWLISLETMLMLYGLEGKSRVMEVHQELKSRGFLKNWRDIPSDAEVVFVSHEWLSWAHPDPDGDQLRVLCRVLERLKEGKLNTEMDPIHTIMYKHKFTTKGKEWKDMLRRTYLWVDWFSMPQPGAEKEEEIGKERMTMLRAEGSRAIQSIPAYVERSDFIMILVPSLYHSDRDVPTCYRTWRKRGWCLLELYAASMARDSSNPPLLVRSERGTPSWMSPLEILKLSIGLADFTCCQRNHVLTTVTQKIMSDGKVKKIPCDKPIAGGILEQLIDAKISHLFNAEGDLVMARLHYVLKRWWMRELKSKKINVAHEEDESIVQTFKKKLRWSHDEKWFDRGSVGLLTYAVISNDVKVIKELLECLKQKFKGKEYARRLNANIRDCGYRRLGIPGGTNTLMFAMLGSSEVVEMLLKAGANVEGVDVLGQNAFMFASLFGRAKNLEHWIHKVKGWSGVNRVCQVFGSTALSKAAFVGPNKLKTIQTLLNLGAQLDSRTHSGGTVLTAATDNEDSDPEVVRLILEKFKSSCSSIDTDFTSFLNYQRQPKTLKWKSTYLVAKALYHMGLVNSGLMTWLAIESGTTPLNHAVIRGDVEIVNILLEFGADPYVENDLGMNAFVLCKKFGPFPKVREALKKKRRDRALFEKKK